MQAIVHKSPQTGHSDNYRYYPLRTYSKVAVPEWMETRGAASQEDCRTVDKETVVESYAR